MDSADYYDADSSNNNDEYTSARKLVQRAAMREAALAAADGDSRSGSEFGSDFSGLRLKPDHIQRPCWTCPDGIIYLEAFHDLYVSAYDFLVAISEPVARPEQVHQYKLTPYSLYAAVATNIETEAIISVLERLSKNALPAKVKTFIRDSTQKVRSCPGVSSSIGRLVEPMVAAHFGAFSSLRAFVLTVNCELFLFICSSCGTVRESQAGPQTQQILRRVGISHGPP
jgi:Helicase conserved C-terminal domain